MGSAKDIKVGRAEQAMHNAEPGGARGDRPPLERLLLALQAAAEELEGLGAALAEGEGPP